MPGVTRIDIGLDYARNLGPRYIKDGEFSGEDFRTKFLEPAYLRGDTVVIALDAITGFSPSFFEEAFGGLVRKHGEAVLGMVEFQADKRAYFVPTILAWMRDAVEDFRASKR